MKLCQSRFSPQCKLSQQDLRDISEKIIQNYAPHENLNLPELVLMPVDPENLYAYWNLKQSSDSIDTPQMEKPLALRIYSLPEVNESHSHIKLSFDIRVDGFQNQKKIRLPLAASAYSAVIGELDADNSFCPLASSEPINIPRKNPTPAQEQVTPENLTLKEQSENISHKQSDKAQENHSENQLLNNIILASFKNNIIISDSLKTLPKTSVLQNFHDYGYDLTIYQNPHYPNSQMTKPTSVLSWQSHQNSLYTLHNASGLGL